MIPLSFVLSTQKTNFKAAGFGDFEKTCFALANMGYQGVELAVRNPDELDLNLVKDVLSASDLTPVAIGTGQAFVDEGLSLSHENEDVRKAAIERIQKQVELAAELKTSVILGLIRGGVVPQTRLESAGAHLRRSLKELLPFAEDKQVVFFLEPLNRYECSFVKTLEDGSSLIHEFDSPFMKLAIDTYHMNVEEASLEQSIELYAGEIEHIQFSDSNRRAPGKGHIDFAKLMSKLHVLRYKGFVSFEILPEPSLIEAAQESMDHIQNIALSDNIANGALS